MNGRLRYLFPLFLFLLSSFQEAAATHIVGGEMNYTCLGDDQYEITLTIYRDCFYGNPNAYFDDPASIGIFDINNQLLQQVLVPLMGDDTLAPILTDECLVVPPDVCVHTTMYSTVVNLPPIIGGYQLAYQRCCRNQTINNIINPLGTGATFGVRITERALLECNSSAQFLQWPPLYICANEPIIFDQSAFDIDGDSIVYRLCTPLQGADPDVPRPQPPNAPPYDEVVWVDPPYNTSNMLNGEPGGVPLQINEQTGLLTGVPNTVGQFVVGICVEEYRDGELISTTRRDFQYNVGICGQITAAFLAPEIQCGDLNVAFDNQSSGTNTYLWLFGDPSNPTASSDLPNPTYSYADTGRYTVTLIAAPGEVCADTFSQEIYLQFNSLLPNFTLDTLSCGDSLVVQINDFSTDTISSIVGWQWLVNGEEVATGPDPSLTFTEAGTNMIDLILTAENGCTLQQSSTIEASFLQEELESDTIFFCPGASRFLNPEFNEDYVYLWSPVDNLSDPMSPNPLANPDETTTYILQITDPTSGCVGERQITTVVVEPITLDLGPDFATCLDSVTIVATSNTAVRIFWSEDPGFVNIIDDGETFTVGAFGETTYYAIALDEAGCQIQDSITIDNQSVNVQALQQDTFICLGQSLAVELENLDIADTLAISWSPTEWIISGDGTPAVELQPTNTGVQVLSYEIDNQYGCTFRDSLELVVIDTTDQTGLLEYVQCSGNHVYFSSSSPNAAVYQWQFGDPNQPGAVGFGGTVDHVYSAAGTYEVTVTLPPSVICQDTLLLTVEVDDPTVELDLDWAYESCADTAVIQLLSESTNSTATIIEWEWLVDDTLVLNGESVQFTLEQSSTLPVSLTVTASNGCVDTLHTDINVPLIDLSLVDSLQICVGDTTGLNPAANAALSYSWSPELGLDNATAANPIASPVENTLYAVTVSDPESICLDTGSVYVSVPPDFSYELPADSAFCGNSALLFVDSETDLDVIWALDAGFTQVVSVEPNFTASVGSQSVFHVQLTDEFGCQRLDQVVLDNQSVQLLLEPAATLCVGDTLELLVETFGLYPATSFSWEPSSGILSGANTATPLVNPTQPTVYNLTASNSQGCTVDTSIAVNIFNFVPPLMIVPPIDTITQGESVQVQATDNPSYVYTWSPPDFLDATDVPNPIASPEETTTYLLTIRDANGCINTAELLLVVLNPLCREPYIFIPNAFTPNGDNLNDVLLVEGSLIEEMYLAIYDRWGELVFESSDKSFGWDGTFRGKELPADTYGFILEVLCVGGEEYLRKGNISLLR